MKINFFVIVKLILIIIIPLQLLGNDSTKIDGKMGFLVDGINAIKYKDARIAFDLWKNEISENNDIHPSIEYIDTEEEIINGYKNFEFQYITMNPFFYLKNMKLIDKLTQSCLITKEGKEDFDQYVLLVRDKKIKTFKDLKGKRVAIKDDDYLSTIFLELEGSKKLSKNFRISSYDIIKTKKNSTAILNTFFGKADACVVPLSTYELVIELNPSISKKLKKLIVSEKIFMPIVTFFHKDSNKKFVDIITNEIDVLTSTSRGRNILNLFKMNEIKPIECKELEPIKEFYKKYELLKSTRK